MICKVWDDTPSHENDRLTSLQVSVTHSCTQGRAGEMLSPVTCILCKHEDPSLEPWPLQEISEGRGDRFRKIFRAHLPASPADWWAPGSVRDPVSKQKVRSDREELNIDLWPLCPESGHNEPHQPRDNGKPWALKTNLVNGTKPS